MEDIPELLQESSDGEWLPDPQPTTSGSSHYPIPGVATPHCYDEAQQPLNRCVGRCLQLTELLQDLVYEDIAAPLTKTERSHLEAVHQKWMLFRAELA